MSINIIVEMKKIIAVSFFLLVCLGFLSSIIYSIKNVLFQHIQSRVSVKECSGFTSCI